MGHPGGAEAWQLIRLTVTLEGVTLLRQITKESITPRNQIRTKFLVGTLDISHLSQMRKQHF